MNPKIVCSYRYSSLDTPVALVGFQMKGREPRLQHVCQGEYVDMHEIDLDGAEQKICRTFIDNRRMGGKPKKSKMVQHSTVYRKDELEED